MAAFKLAWHILLVFSPKYWTKNCQKSGFSINKSRHPTHPFIYFNAHIIHIIHHIIQQQVIVIYKTGVSVKAKLQDDACAQSLARTTSIIMAA